MPRRVRCVWPGVPYHVTQRGVDRRDTFTINDDRTTYLKLLGQNLPDAGVRLLGWCLMSNHVHLIAVPEREDSLAVCMRRVHGRYAQYYNARHGRNGHLWQNRYFACALGHSHLWIALAYVEQNPLWAGLAPRAEEYRWSSAAAHVTGQDETGLLDMTWWREEGQGAQWAQTLALDLHDRRGDLQRCTYAGMPFGDESFGERMSDRFGRHWYWQRGRPTRKDTVSKAVAAQQGALFRA